MTCQPIVRPHNETMPGDFCESDSECFGLNGEVSCQDGACVTSRQIDDYCYKDSTANGA